MPESDSRARQTGPRRQQQGQAAQFAPISSAATHEQHHVKASNFKLRTKTSVSPFKEHQADREPPTNRTKSTQDRIEMRATVAPRRRRSSPDATCWRQEAAHFGPQRAQSNDTRPAGADKLADVAARQRQPAQSTCSGRPLGLIALLGLVLGLQLGLGGCATGAGARGAHFAEPETPASLVQRVAVGRSVIFKCVVNHIGAHKVSWFHRDRRLLLAFDNKTVTWHERLQVSSQANSVFFLQIDSVQLSDKGHFVCQLNTQPVQSQTHILDVVKSPQIKEEETTVNIGPVKEFSSVELRCVADGVPKPVIKWRRESKTHELPALHADDEDYGETSNAVESHELGAGNRENGKEKNGDAKITSGRSNYESDPQMAAKSGQISLDDDGRVDRTLGRYDHLNAADSSPRQANSAIKDPRNHPRERLRRQSALSDINLTIKGRKVFAESLSSPSFEGQQFEPRILANRAARRSAQATLELSSPQNASQPANSPNQQNAFLAEGEVLRLDRVSRYDMGFYMCIASNGVSPSVSQRIFLPVLFVPRDSSASLESEAKTRSGADGSGERRPEDGDDDDSGAKTDLLQTPSPSISLTTMPPNDSLYEPTGAASAADSWRSKLQTGGELMRRGNSSKADTGSGAEEPLTRQRQPVHHQAKSKAVSGEGTGTISSIGRNHYQAHRNRHLKAARSSATTLNSLTSLPSTATSSSSSSSSSSSTTTTKIPSNFWLASDNIIYNQFLLLEVLILLLLKVGGFEWV